MRIAICEDTAKDASDLHEMLDSFFDGRAHIDVYSTGMALIASYEKPLDYHIVFLDIFMPGMNGMEVARAIRKTDDATVIIFVTHAREYAVDGYWVNAYRYLIKPIQYDQLTETLVKIIEKKIDSHNLILQMNGETYNISIDDIVHIEKSGKKTIFHMLNGESIQSRLVIREIMDIFADNESFVAPFQSFIVNMKHVESISKQSKKIKMVSGSVIPIARDRLTDVYDAYTRYIGGEDG